MAEKIYLYLARRDKTGMKLVCSFPTDKTIPPTRLNDLKGLNLSAKIEQEISKTIEVNKMLFEPWIETASSYQGLTESIKKRGYKNVPVNSSPIHEAHANIPKINITSRKTMLRKSSSFNILP